MFPFLCWDQQHPDLWLECLFLSNDIGLSLTARPQAITQKKPSPQMPQPPFVTVNQILDCVNIENPFHQFEASSTRDAAPEPSATIISSACPIKEIPHPVLDRLLI